MARTSPSPADRRLIDLAAQQGAEVSARHLERWRSHPNPLLPAHHRAYPGRPSGGSVSTADEQLVTLVVWLAQNRRQGADRSHLALRAFGAGLPVPEETVRHAFARPAEDLAKQLRRGFGPMPVDGDLQEWVFDGAADLVGTQERRLTAAQRRLRAIDRQVLARPDLAQGWQFATELDPGLAEADALDRTDFQFHSAITVMAGPGEMTPDTLARAARGFVTDGTPQWAAHLLKTDPREPLAALSATPRHQLPGVPADSIANHLYTVAQEAPVERLLAAWAAAEEIPAWAEATCAAVEAELSADQPAEVTQQWAMGMFLGASRTFLLTGLSEPDPTLTERTMTAVQLILMADAFNITLAITDDDGRSAMRQLAPPFLLGLLTVG
ncbi:hypothetical protein OG196_31655 [Kitasatospora purpeofusca]|uniref:hypothetical protein n=1 Tax=Kitasatospora purpeofusca TaxID=67352 RepID=UPI002E151C2E|nr:hypothetical protein OG196_31655 [Kitasatospora purpeofusca]